MKIIPSVSAALLLLGYFTAADAQQTISNVKYEASCTGVTAHDDTIVSDAFSWASSNHGLAILSGPTCAFVTAVSVGAVSNWSVAGLGMGATTLLYEGSSLTNDLISIGSTSTSSLFITLSNFTLDSNVTGHVRQGGVNRGGI